MEISYSDPKFQIRLTGYADTVIIDSGTQQTISAIRFGGYPEVVRALSDAIYGGASVELNKTIRPYIWIAGPKATDGCCPTTGYMPLRP